MIARRSQSGCFVVSLLLAIVVFPRVAVAQDSAPSKTTEILIEQIAPMETVKGTLIQLGPESLRVLVGTDTWEVALANVLTIKVRGDSVKNGALIGGIIGAVWCALICGQGLDSTSDVPLVVAANAGFFALIGAGVDALSPGYTTIYRRTPTRQANTRAPTLSVRWRF
jgi:hypothetical protein